MPIQAFRPERFRTYGMLMRLGLICKYQVLAKRLKGYQIIIMHHAILLSLTNHVLFFCTISFANTSMDTPRITPINVGKLSH